MYNFGKIRHTLKHITIHMVAVWCYRWWQRWYMEIFLLLFIAMSIGIIVLWHIAFYTSLLSFEEEASVRQQQQEIILDRILFDRVILNEKERRRLFIDNDYHDNGIDPFYLESI